MHSGKESFKGEREREWDRQNRGEGGGQILRIKGARYDDHSDTANRLREIERRSNQTSSFAKR